MQGVIILNVVLPSNNIKLNNKIKIYLHVDVDLEQLMKLMLNLRLPSLFILSHGHA